jgi:hypothetical protein
MLWRRTLAQVLVFIVTLGLLGSSLYWSVGFATETLGLFSAWLFPEGAPLPTVMAWAGPYVLLIIGVYCAAIMGPMLLVLGALHGFSAWMGWTRPLPPCRQRREEYD